MANLVRDPNQLIPLLHLGVIDQLGLTGLGHAALLQLESPLGGRRRQSPVGVVIRVVVGLDWRPPVIHDGVQQDPVVIRWYTVRRGRLPVRQLAVLLEAKYVVHLGVLMIALGHEAFGALALVGIGRRVAGLLTVVRPQAQARLPAVHLRPIGVPVELVAVAALQRDLLYDVAGGPHGLLHGRVLLPQVPLVRGLGGAVLVRQGLEQLGSVHLIPGVVRVPGNVVLQVVLDLVVRVLGGHEPLDHVLYQPLLDLLVAFVGVDQTLQDVDAPLEIPDQAV